MHMINDGQMQKVFSFGLARSFEVMPPPKIITKIRQFFGCSFCLLFRKKFMRNTSLLFQQRTTEVQNKLTA